MTRPGCLRLQMTPSQLQWGTPTCQDLKACLELLVMARLKSSSEVMSVLLSWTVVVEEQWMLQTPQETSSNDSSVRMWASLAV